MKNLLLFTLLILSSFSFGLEVNFNSTVNLIEQEETPKNLTDESGKKQGPWLILGKDKPEKGYPELGKIEEGPYLDNRKNGLWTKYHKDGMTPRLIGNYVNGRAKGDFTKHFENGQVKEKGTRGNKKMTGTLVRYFEDGTVKQEKTFNAEGKEDGKQVMYHPNGKVWLEYETKNGVKTGTQIRYTETGEVKQKITYNPDGTIGEKEEFEVKEVVEEVIEKGGTGPKGVGQDTNGEPFKSNGYNKTYNSDKELEQDGKFKNGYLWDGKLYKYDSDGILLKIEIWKLGKYHSEGQL